MRLMNKESEEETNQRMRDPGVREGPFNLTKNQKALTTRVSAQKYSGQRMPTLSPMIQLLLPKTPFSSLLSSLISSSASSSLQ